ncbi:DUF3558 domain-containing protein [Nocardia donostiensis]|uniref:DUF3558 domain-containing protein n=1 Tax=Nocardia donostiensis TaxID=1538463 RepID=A0A1W0BP86_9NOCA|nr:DUF3558 domain-containing protein [Nocardia donostiensis]ONM47538.1 hypothetical protein B0T46_16635 [Nocardia donostiensis]OQS24292.1 hypothetical protein B0T44_01405 [Nocardia donostiensis]
MVGDYSEGGSVSYRSRVRRGIGVLVAAGFVVAGCGGETGGTAEPEQASQVSASGEASVGETSAPETSSSEEALWDPCGLPESALTETGMVPASEEAGIGSVDWTDAGWKVCKWKATAGWYSLTVFSGTPSLADVQARTDFKDFRPKTSGSRQAVQFLQAGSSEDLRCHLAVELQQGTAIFTVTARASIGAQEDPCVVVGRHATDLAVHLPE